MADKPTWNVWPPFLISNALFVMSSHFVDYPTVNRLIHLDVRPSPPLHQLIKRTPRPACELAVPFGEANG
jgi:hypothetical protein